ncbi:hypothetical protein Q5752_003949 [Cryptotrichosporon argae]
MDYPSLNLGHPAVSETDVSIVGLDLKVYGLDEIRGSTLPLAVVIALHGRCNSLKNMVWFAHGLLGELGARGPASARRRDVVVVTLDQRNHGARTRDRTANLAFDENPRHFVDMAAMVYGAGHDVSLVVDFLPAYLFPNAERAVEEWIVTGISLGGNAAWKILRDDPHINIGIPIIGLPFTSFTKYLSARATSMGFGGGPPLFPAALRDQVDAPSPAAAYRGKKILSLHGGADTLVPYAKGKDDLDAIVAANENVDVWVQDGIGHACTTDMVRRAAEWVWTWAVKPEDSKL